MHLAQLEVRAQAGVVGELERTRAARMLEASSKFGAQMDSLADIVNFGVAPALVLYAFILLEAGSFGWIAALMFAIACALRQKGRTVDSPVPPLPCHSSLIQPIAMYQSYSWRQRSRFAMTSWRK